MKKCKIFQKLMALTVSAIMLAVLPNANVLTASAEEPTTYYLMYSEGDEDWRYQLGSTWNDDAESTPSYYLHQNIKNGDIVIIGNASVSSMLTLNVRLSNLTICNTTDTLAMVSATGGIDNCIFTDNTRAAITGNVTNAHVYGSALANFNNNVVNLYSHELTSDSGPTIGVSGTVSWFAIEDTYGNTKPYGTDYKADSFRMTNGNPDTDSGNYTQPASGSPAATPSQPSAPQATKAPASSSTASDEYDDVPKTGEASPALWLAFAAVTCFGLHVALKRKL